MGPMERAGHGGDCNNCGMAAASARGSCVGILHWRVAGDRNPAWTRNSCVFAADFRREKTEEAIEKAHFVVMSGRKTADIVVQKTK